MFGIGHTLMEEMVYEDGQLLNPNLVDYRVPTFQDLPEHLHTILIENGNGPGPFVRKASARWIASRRVSRGQCCIASRWSKNPNPCR
jgi:hypothetical protein